MEYTGVEILGAASPNGPIVCCGTPINMDDMEVVGTGAKHTPNGDAGVEVYRPRAGAPTDVYTFDPAQTVEVSQEPGGTDTGPATWVRWTDDVAPPAPAVTGMIVPDLRLTFEGVEYSRWEMPGAASPNGPTVCCGTPINTDNMEVVGTGTSHTPDGDASEEVYRPKTGATTDVYMFRPTQAGPAEWIRWMAD